MQLILIILGALLGGWLADIDADMLGIALGAAVGYLLAELRTLRLELQRLELERKAGPGQSPSRPAPGRASPATDPEPAAAHRHIETPRRSAEASAAAARDRAPWPQRGPTVVDRLWQRAKGWLTSGNVPVKVGVIISFFGIAFLLRYAVDRQVLVVPVELRLLVVAAAAVVLFGIGWRLREKNAVYALSLQGGGIGILYLTIFAAFRLYALLPAMLAFAMLVVMTAAVGVLAVLQNARWLAILATVGGFLAPLLTSTGQGSHVALFSYYLILNAAILGISWYRAWRSLNLIGFAFTFGVGTLWGYDYYRPVLYASTQPFLILYFLFYQAIAVLFAFRQTPDLRGLVDGTILFGTPVIAFALQAELVGNTDYGLAISSALVGVFYVLLAYCLYRRHREQLRLMIESYAALAIAFATIAIPLALDARWTAAAWALEGAALIWVGVRQHGLLARLSGAGLLIASGAAYIDAGWSHDAGIALLNGNALGGFLISAAAIFGAWRLHRDTKPHRGQAAVSIVLLPWGIVWWLAIGGLEIDDRVAYGDALHAYTLFAALSAVALAWLARRLAWPAARHATLAYLPLLVLYGVLYLLNHEHLFAGAGALGWSFAVVAHFVVLRFYEMDAPRREGYWHAAGALLLMLALAQEAYWRLDAAGLGETWSGGGALLVMALVASLIMALRERLAWPLQRYWTEWLAAAGAIIVLQLLLLTSAGIERPGDPAPLTYLPILNPFDVLTLVGLVVALRGLRLAKATTELVAADRFRTAVILWSLAAFVLTTIAVVRGVHHVAGVAWSDGALMRSVSVQAALSIYWGMLGFAGMLFGAWHANRIVWIAGTALMALVVVKLFLVDLGNTGTVARIVSFLGVGGLLLVVGYFAPAPPRRSA